MLLQAGDCKLFTTGLEGAGEAVRNAARIGEGYDVGVPLRANAA
jgi:hypothetical protein